MAANFAKKTVLAWFALSLVAGTAPSPDADYPNPFRCLVMASLPAAGRYSSRGIMAQCVGAFRPELVVEEKTRRLRRPNIATRPRWSTPDGYS